MVGDGDEGVVVSSLDEVGGCEVVCRRRRWCSETASAAALVRACVVARSKAVLTLVGVGTSVSKSFRCWSPCRRGVMYVGILA